MPTKPPRQCPRCRQLVPGGQRCRCAPNTSPSSTITSQRRYRKMKAVYLATHPVCEHHGCPYPAAEVDHIKPVHTHAELAFDVDNLQALCRDHHQAKTNADRRRRPPDDDDEFTASLPPR